MFPYSNSLNIENNSNECVFIYLGNSTGSYSVMVSTSDFESDNLSSSLSKTLFMYYISNTYLKCKNVIKIVIILFV